MPRNSRNILTDFTHIMCQGIDKEYIYEKNSEKLMYIKLIKKYSEKYNINLISYCIMGNHAHIISYSKDHSNISKFMKDVNCDYARFYNKTRNRVGYIFRDRFNSVNIETQNQLKRCIKYIHMNPVKAHIVEREEDYKFSSYNDFINKTGIVNKEILGLVFNSEDNYLEKFYSIEDNPKGIKIDVEDDLENFINEFVKNNNIDKEDIIENKFFIKKLFENLENKWGEFEIKELAQILGCEKKKLYRKKRGCNK